MRAGAQAQGKSRHQERCSHGGNVLTQDAECRSGGKLSFREVVESSVGQRRGLAESVGIGSPDGGSARAETRGRVGALWTRKGTTPGLEFLGSKTEV